MMNLLSFDENRQPDLVVETIVSATQTDTYLCWNYPSGPANAGNPTWKICLVRKTINVGSNIYGINDPTITELLWPNGSKDYKFAADDLSSYNYVIAY